MEFYGSGGDIHIKSVIINYIIITVKHWIITAIINNYEDVFAVIG
jgi:hypothetical protein